MFTSCSIYLLFEVQEVFEDLTSSAASPLLNTLLFDVLTFPTHQGMVRILLAATAYNIDVKLYTHNFTSITCTLISCFSFAEYPSL